MNASANTPTLRTASLETARLTLRIVETRDLPDLLPINSDPQVTQFLPYATWQSLDDASAWLARMRSAMETGAAAQFVIERKSDRHVVGSLLLFHYDEGSARAELGYVIGRAHWRQGVAREAIVGALGFAFDVMKMRRVEAQVNPSNVGSNRLLHALGFTLEGTLRQRWRAKGVTYDVNMFRMLSEEFAAIEKVAP